MKSFGSYQPNGAAPARAGAFSHRSLLLLALRFLHSNFVRRTRGDSARQGLRP